MLTSSRTIRVSVSVVIAAATLTALAVQCVAMRHRDMAAVPLSHHAVAAGSPRQFSAVTVHDHIGKAVVLGCSAGDAVATAVATPVVPRLLWLAASMLAVCVLASAIGVVPTRGPPSHTGAAAIIGGRTLIHHLCVLRR
ncbi:MULTISPECIES: hypothetical protein [unclassified Mycobacterium]|uniref:hypothetical protein n=1 Tax=unclassified Mycobacterium TaxID=2642494 RepID=UPI0009928EE3|nr:MULTISPECIES: hypothetical protein [unclassified Mycobacterium]